jgi:hypothetical protein
MDTGAVLGIIGIGLAAIGIIMAAPPIFQMFFGRPNLQFSASEFTGSGGKMLHIEIKNNVMKKTLKIIGVQREIGNIFAYFDIQEDGTGKYIQKDISARLHNAPLRENGLSARAFPGFTVGAHIVHALGEKTVVVNGRSDALVPIPPGNYVALVTVICGDEVHHLRRTFKVGTQQHETVWV